MKKKEKGKEKSYKRNNIPSKYDICIHIQYRYIYKEVIWETWESDEKDNGTEGTQTYSTVERKWDSHSKWGKCENFSKWKCYPKTVDP